MDTSRIWARRIKRIGQVIWPILRQFYHVKFARVKRFLQIFFAAVVITQQKIFVKNGENLLTARKTA